MDSLAEYSTSKRTRKRVHTRGRDLYAQLRAPSSEDYSTSKQHLTVRRNTQHTNTHTHTLSLSHSLTHSHTERRTRARDLCEQLRAPQKREMVGHEFALEKAMQDEIQDTVVE